MMMAVTVIGVSNGRMMWRNTCHSLAPSTRDQTLERLESDEIHIWKEADTAG
jgi:hypothetical protein